MSVTTSISYLFSYFGDRSDAFALHALIEKGLPRDTLSALCSVVNISEREFTKVFALPTLKKADQVLSRGASDAVYRVVDVLSVLQSKFSGKDEEALRWLTTACPLLRGRIPLMLLATSMGQEYVKTAISRLPDMAASV